MCDDGVIPYPDWFKTKTWDKDAYEKYADKDIVPGELLCDGTVVTVRDGKIYSLTEYDTWVGVWFRGEIWPMDLDVSMNAQPQDSVDVEPCPANDPINVFCITRGKKEKK